MQSLEEMAQAEMTPEPGAAVLDEVHAFLARFVAYPSEHAHVAHTLWIAHAHLMDAWDSTPRIAFLSPEPGSGKSRALEVSALLVPRPVEAVNVTPAYLFRKVGSEGGRPTILYDEIDTVFGPKAKDNEEIRGLLNAGHRQNATAGRCVVRGKEVFTEDIPAYCAVALAGLGGLPDTILTRSVIVRMRRRAPTEKVEPYRRRVHLPEGERIGSRLATWAAGVEGDITWPDMPDGIYDRDADVWEALLAVADAAGGHWPETARGAAVAIVAASKEGTPSLGVQLLSDLREIFGSDAALKTEVVLERLHALDESPWADLRGKPLNALGLSRRLRQYGIKPRTIRVADATSKGYRRDDLWDAWERYLPPLSDKAVTPVTSVTSETPRGFQDGEPVTEPVTPATEAVTNPAPVTDVTGVTAFGAKGGDAVTAMIEQAINGLPTTAAKVRDELAPEDLDDIRSSSMTAANLRAFAESLIEHDTADEYRRLKDGEL